MFGNMHIVQGIENLSHLVVKSVVTIGNFDGVHKGHQFLIGELVSRARKQGVPSVVFTFNPHPVQVLRPEKALNKLFDFKDQERELARLGVDYLIVEPFSREFSQLEPQQFLTRYLFKPLGPLELIVGYDFTFGANRAGTIDLLKELCQQAHVRVEALPPLSLNGQVVSSSRIRQALKDGDVNLAQELLGRPFYVHGLVEKGAGRGRTIGVPTANVRVEGETMPRGGVYACWSEVRGERFRSVANIGYNPTFVAAGEIAKPQLEVHLLDVSKDLYGEDLRVEFIEYLREEKKFPSVEALVTQLRQDIERGREVLA